MVGLVGSHAPGQVTPADYVSRRLASGKPLDVPADQRAAGRSNAPSSAQEAAKTKPVQPGSQSAETTEKSRERGGPPGASGEEELTESEERKVRDLKQRDQEVRAHEQAHTTVGGSYASAPSYEYTVGPDGKRYATGGEVKIDASPVRDNPKATIRKMEIVIRAALAPAEPSSQDLQVARQAQETRSQAQAELTKQEDAERTGSDRSKNSGTTAASIGGAAYEETARRSAEQVQDIFSQPGSLFAASA